MSSTDPFLNSPRPAVALLDESIIINMVRYLFGLTAILGNLFLLTLLIKYRKLRESRCNVFIGSLAVADLLIGIGLLIRASYALYAFSCHQVLFLRSTCVLVNLTQGIGLNMSHIALLAIAFDRFAAVWSPLKYQTENSWALNAAVFSCLLFFASCFVFVHLFHVDTENATLLVCSMGPAAGPYAGFWQGLFAQSTVVLLCVFYILNLAIFIGRTRSWSKDGERTKIVQRKVTVSILILLCMYSLFWGVPNALLILGKYTNESETIATYVTYSIGLISGLNSASSIFIYLYKHDELRRFAKVFVADKLSLRKPEFITHSKITPMSNINVSQRSGRPHSSANFA